MNWRIPLADIDLGEPEKAAVQKVLNKGWLTMSEETQALEEEFAAYIGVRHAIAVTNGTAALHMAYTALGLQPGDEVILPALTFVATAAAVRHCGANPVFADIEGEHNLNISPASIEKCLTERTRAIAVMHYGGYACNMPAILAIATKHNLPVIEDAAHSPGSMLHDRKLGAWGTIGCFSFFSNKNLTTGEGGMVTTNDDQLAEKLRLLRSHGMTSLTWDRHRGHAWSYDVVELGYNYRIDEIRAAIGRVQLQKLEANNENRRNLTELYRQLLKEHVPEIGLPFHQDTSISACHLFPILLPADVDRELFMEKMKTEGIQTSIHYPPIHKFRLYKDDPSMQPVSLKETEQAASREVTLPLYPALKPNEIRMIVRAVFASLEITEKIKSTTLNK
jgi:dTDP-4-amino-4,6-dideoxygalactose transaminase